jgi:hypothetical protein
MNSEELEFLGKQKTNVALKVAIDRVSNCSGELAIFLDDICKYNKETTRKVHLDLLSQALKVL